MLPEKRGVPRQRLLDWIAQTLEKGVEAGFLKKQKNAYQSENLDDSVQHYDNLANLYEFSHDFLSDFCQQFVVDFESWLRSRFYILLGFVIGLLAIAPVLYLAVKIGFLQVFYGFLFVILFSVVYALAIWLTMLIMAFLGWLIGYPIIRQLIKGEVPLRKK